MDDITAIEALKKAVLKMKDLSIEERVKNLSNIKTILNQIKGNHGAEIKNLEFYSRKLLRDCDKLCNPNPDSGHDDTQYICWALEDINKLESFDCLKLK